MNVTGKQLARRLLRVQILATLLTALLFLVVKDSFSALAAIVGGLISVVPNMVFAAFAFAYAGARSSQQLVRSFFAGEGLKIILTAGLFAAVLSLLALPLAPLFSGFVAALAMQWLAPILLLKST